MQQAEMECYKVKGTAHGASHSRAVAEEQHRQAQQELGKWGGISEHHNALGIQYTCEHMFRKYVS